MEEANLLVSCPYNPAHRISKFKLMNHMSKCKKTNKAANMVECPLDKSHVVDRECLREHIASCSSVGKLAYMSIGSEPKEETKATVVNSCNSTENWEEEPEVPSYDPMQISANQPVIRCVSGLTKSERRKFRDNERKRIANLKEYPGADAASSSMGYNNDTIQEEVPLRPPRNATVLAARISQNDSMKTHDRNGDAGVQASAVPEFRNDLFHKMLYDELAPEEDSADELEKNLRKTDTPMSFKDYFQQVAKEKGNVSVSDRNQETKVEKSKTDATSQLINVNNIKNKKDEGVAGTSSMPSERVTDKLLALLKDESRYHDAKNIQPAEETNKIDKVKKDSSETALTSDELFSQFNERLAYLRDIQNAAAEESALLLEKLKDLRFREAIRK